MADEATKPIDLHLGVRDLSQLLRDAAERGDAINAYLYCCALKQIVEDWRESTDSAGRRLTAVAGDRGAARRALRIGVDGSNSVLRAVGPTGAAARLRGEVEQLTNLLADIVVERSQKSADALPVPARDLALRIADTAARRLPGGLLTGAARPPSCFRSFDQHPRDCAELAWRFALEYDAREAPVLVLGVRTSGGYLAPLIAAALRATGFRRAEAATMRPGGRLPRAALRRVRRPRPGPPRSQGFVAVVDDPPTTGGSIAKVVRAVRRQGIAPAQVVALYAAFEGRPPDKLQADLPSVVLPATAWHIRRLLNEASISATVRAAFPDDELIGVRAEAPGLPTRERHLGVRVTATFRTDDGFRETELFAEAAGIGCFGEHARDVSQRLSGYVPKILALHDGVLLRTRGEPMSVRDVAPAEVAAYVAARRDRLRVPVDRSTGLRGRQPAWEAGARILSAGFGRLAPAVRPFLIDPALRSLLRAHDPCLTDGRTAFGAWESNAAHAHDGALKTEFDEGCFGHLDLACYDAAFDLAGAAVARPGSERELREAYAEFGDEPADRARRCVYEYIQAWNLERISDGRRAESEARQARSRAVQRFFGDLFLGDINIEPTGPWVVLDVDGVLELDFGGIPVTTLAAMRALRALRAHGYRVALATGRSLPEVRDRCAAYRLAGGVAEYGAVAYVAETGEAVPLPEATVTGGARNALISELIERPTLRLDPLYSWCVRVSLQGSDGPRGLRGLTLSRMSATHAGFVPVLGEAQTDFVPAGVEKSQGVLALLKQLGAAQEQVVLAVGDTSMDLGILGMAQLGLAPAHASNAVRAAGIRRTQASYQAGLAEAVGRLLGHRAGGCALCAPPRLGSAERLVATLLSVGESGRRGLVPAAAGLAALRLRGGAPWT